MADRIWILGNEFGWLLITLLYVQACGSGTGKLQHMGRSLRRFVQTILKLKSPQNKINILNILNENNERIISATATSTAV